MKPKTFEFLTILLWSVDQLMRPTFRNLTESYESWAYRNGFMRQLALLEKQQLIERADEATGDRVYRLTAQGRLQALGGRDPEAQWSRPWDGYWRLVLFDIPMARNAHRDQLRRYLRGRSFGCLQNSVWITPDPLHQECQLLAGGKVNVQSILLLEARSCAGESNAEIVAGAWDFKRLNQGYARHLKILDDYPDGSLLNEAAAKALLRWATMERAAWIEAVTSDPLLPQSLLPDDYLGQKTWQRRVEIFREAGRQLSTFNLGSASQTLS